MAPVGSGRAGGLRGCGAAPGGVTGAGAGCVGPPPSIPAPPQVLPHHRHRSLASEGALLKGRPRRRPRSGSQAAQGAVVDHLQVHPVPHQLPDVVDAVFDHGGAVEEKGGVNRKEPPPPYPCAMGVPPLKLTAPRRAPRPGPRCSPGAPWAAAAPGGRSPSSPPRPIS